MFELADAFRRWVTSSVIFPGSCVCALNSRRSLCGMCHSCGTVFSTGPGPGPHSPPSLHTPGLPQTCTLPSVRTGEPTGPGAGGDPGTDLPLKAMRPLPRSRPRLPPLPPTSTIGTPLPANASTFLCQPSGRPRPRTCKLPGLWWPMQTLPSVAFHWKDAR